jgi:hypothetical protein
MHHKVPFNSKLIAKLTASKTSYSLAILIS